MKLAVGAAGIDIGNPRKIRINCDLGFAIVAGHSEHYSLLVFPLPS